MNSNQNISGTKLELKKKEKKKRFRCANKTKNLTDCDRETLFKQKPWGLKKIGLDLATLWWNDTIKSRRKNKIQMSNWDGAHVKSDYFSFQSTFDFLGGFLEAKEKDIKTNLLSQDRFDISTHTAELQSNWSDCEFSIYLAVSPCRWLCRHQQLRLRPMPLHSGILTVNILLSHFLTMLVIHPVCQICFDK